MAKFILVAISAAADGRDDEYNAWYEAEHRHDICALPGVQSCRRFDASPESPNPAPAPYLALYEVESDDPAGLIDEMKRRAISGEIRRSDTLDRSTAQLWLYQER